MDKLCIENIYSLLESYKEEKIVKYARRVYPDAKNVLGVSVTNIRKVAKTIIKSDFRYFLNNYTFKTHEDVILYGIVIACCNVNIEERLDLFGNFIPHIYDWSSCDIISLSFKFKDNEYKDVYNFLMQYTVSSKEYELRTVIVMLLYHFMDRKYFLDLINVIERIRKDKYYVQMAAAWLLSVMFVKDKDFIYNYLETCNLDYFTYKMTLQKIIESKRVSHTDKNIIKSMREKVNKL